MQASMLPSLLTAQQSNHLTEKAKTCVLVFFYCHFWLIGHFVLVFIPMKLGIVWLRRYFIFFLKR